LENVVIATYLVSDDRNPVQANILHTISTELKKEVDELRPVGIVTLPVQLQELVEELRT